MNAGFDAATWVPRFEAFLEQQGQGDVAHDHGHVLRVVANAERLAAAEGATLAVVLPAAWLHDCVSVAKDSPLRAQASRLAAEAASAWLRQHGYPPQHLDAIAHAIVAHSFSAAIVPQTIEAQVVQDADRLDALGAIGLARCLMLGGALGRALYNPDEPFPQQRQPDDSSYSVDHLFSKLLKLAATMQTAAGRAEAQRRSAFLEAFLVQLGHELGSSTTYPQPADKPCASFNNSNSLFQKD